MGRRLSDWERRQRDNERRSRAAARRAETASRRAAEAKVREKRKAKEKAEKDANTEKEIAANRLRVSNYDNFINTLESLHKNFDITKFESGFKHRLSKRNYKPSNLKEGKPFKKTAFKKTAFKKKTLKKQSVFKAKPFTMATYEKSDFKKEKEVSAGTYTVIMGFLGGFVMLAIDGVIGFWILFGGIIASSLIANSKNQGLEKEYNNIRATKKTEHDKEQAKRKKDNEELRTKEKEESDKEEAKRKEEHDEKEAKRKEEHDEEEAKRKQNFEKRDASNKKKFEENDVKRIELLKQAENKDIESIELVCEAIFPINHKIEYPEDFVLGTINEYEVGYNVTDNCNIEILIELPEFDNIIPTRKISVTPNGKTIRHGELSNRARTQLYDRLINGLAFEHVLQIFRGMPFLNNIKLEAFNIVVDTKTGGDKEKIMLKVDFDKEILMKLKLDRIDPVHAIENFEHVFQSSGKKYKEIKPNIDRENIVWSTSDNKGFDIPYGINPDETAKSLPN